jgi:hypothetical protein
MPNCSSYLPLQHFNLYHFILNQFRSVKFLTTIADTYWLYLYPCYELKQHFFGQYLFECHLI